MLGGNLPPNDFLTVELNIMAIEKQKGVTLIELMVTIAIIAVISAIAIPMYSNYIETAHRTEGWNSLAAIKLAQEEYFLENNRYFPNPDGNVSTTAGNLSTYWTPKESDADRNFNYTVVSSGTGTSYIATAIGRGGKVPVSVSFSVGN